MNIEFFQNVDVDQFLSCNEEYLLLNESLNNLILGLSDSIKRNFLGSSDPLFITLLKDQAVVGQAIRTDSNRPLAIAEMDDEVLECLAKNLAKERVKLAGVVGPKNSCIRFANEWVKFTGEASKLAMHQGVYELVELKEPGYNNGRLTAATANSRDIAERYILGFVSDCFPDEKDPVGRSKEIVERHLKNGSMFFWENSEGEIVSTASKSRESRNAATISLVYTPEEQRGKGYASRIVAQLSNKLLQEGKEKCNLFTDLTNTTSNSIYQKIGYKFLGETLHLNFCKP